MKRYMPITWKYRKAKYSRKRMIAVALDKPSSVSFSALPELIKIVGKRMAMVDNMSKVELICPDIVWKYCTSLRRPPKSSAVPNTSNKFDNIDPKSDN